jgi:hypothetical protein
LFLDPPESTDHIRRRIVSVIAQGIRFPPLSDVSPDLWAQLPNALASEIAAQYTTSFGLDPLANISVHCMLFCLMASHFPESTITDFNKNTKPETTTVQNAIKMVIDGVSSHQQLDILSPTSSPASDLYR